MSGQYPPKSCTPAESELAETQEIARTTIRPRESCVTGYSPTPFRNEAGTLRSRVTEPSRPLRVMGHFKGRAGNRGVTPALPARLNPATVARDLEAAVGYVNGGREVRGRQVDGELEPGSYDKRR